MGERTRNIIVGLTALVALIGVGVMLILFGYVPRWVEKGYIIRIEMPNAAGLSDGSPVRLSGIGVGHVERVDLQSPLSKGVIVTARLKDWARVPKGVTAQTEAPLIGGTPALALGLGHIPPDKPLEYLPTDGSALIRGEAGGLAANVQNAITEGVQEFKKASALLAKSADHFNALADEWRQVGGNVNQMLGPRSVADVDNKAAQANVRSLVERLDGTVKSLQAASDNLNKLVGNPRLQDDILVGIHEVRQFADGLGALRQKAGDLLDSAKTLTGTANQKADELVKRYVAVADDLSAAIGSMRLTLEQARKGEGTLGKLLNDPGLYENLNDASKRLGQALGEFRQLMEKWKAEGLPLKF